MNLIDSIHYEGKEQYTQEQIADAYKALFKSDSLPARIVLQDLMQKSNYGTKAVCADTNVMYHNLGMQAVLEFIRDGLMKPYIDEEQKVASVNDLEVT